MGRAVEAVDAKVLRLSVYDHLCRNVDVCGLKILERAANGGGGKIRKLLLWVPGTGLSMFVGSVDEALKRARQNGASIPQGDLDECRRLIQT